MSLDDFKRIFYMEWGHRVLGRLIGIGFVIPFAYFALRKRLTATLPRHLFGMALLIGAQGALLERVNAAAPPAIPAGAPGAPQS